MALEKFRDVWTKALDPLVEKLGFMDPNHISWFSLLVSGTAAYLLATAPRDSDGGMLLLAGMGLVILAALCDGLDGQIARKHGKDSAYGDFLDHTIDRVVDIGLLVAIGLNTAFLATPHLGFAAAIATLLGSYMGTQAQSVGLGRNYGGFSRADRMVVLMLGTCFAAIEAMRPSVSIDATLPLIGEVNGFSVVLLISLLGGGYTFVVRFMTARKELLE